MFSINYLGLSTSVIFLIILNVVSRLRRFSFRGFILNAISSLMISVVFYVFLEATFLFKGPSIESALFLVIVLWIGLPVSMNLNQLSLSLQNWKQFFFNTTLEAIRLLGIALIYWYARPA